MTIEQYRPGPDAVPQVVSLGGFWVKLAQTASVVSALPDAHLARIGGWPGDPLTHGVLGTDVTHSSCYFAREIHDHLLFERCSYEVSCVHEDKETSQNLHTLTDLFDISQLSGPTPTLKSP